MNDSKPASLDTIDAMLENAKDFASRREAVPAEQKRKRLRPRYKWVVVRKVDPKDRLHSSGIVITEGQARSSIGEIVSFSPMVTDLKRGDLVLYTNFATKLDGMEDATGDKSLYLVRDEEIYTVLEDEE
jgi:co-chaperonin GroES (HSP10)